MSANPRSPESGEPIYLAGQGYVQRDGMWQQLTVYPSPVDRTASDALDMISRLTAELSTARERADRAEQDSKRLDYLAQWGFVRAGSAWCPDAQEMVGHFEWVQPGCWATLMPMQGRDDAWEQDQYVECDIPLRDAVDAAMKTSTPTATPDHA